MDILKDVGAHLIEGSEQQVVEDCMYILIWIVATKFEGVLNLPPRNEMLEIVQRKKVTIRADDDGPGGLLRVRDL